MTTGAPLDPIEFGAERGKQRVARLRDAAAEHNQLRIEKIDARAHRAAEGVD